MKNKIGLILEGGGMRGAFTCGVSAGAGNGLSYISKQRGRAKYITVDLMRERQYIGISYLLSKGFLIDMDLLYKEVPNKIYPFDFETYSNSSTEYEIVTTNCETGKACYFSNQENEKKLVEIARASGSLPYISPIIHIDGIPMLDGGLTDSVPIQRALEQGCTKCVVILTRNIGYRKKKSYFPMPDFMYKKYPQLQKALKKRHDCYNEQLELVEQLEKEGKILVIRPVKPITVDRIEKDANKLENLYKEGYECAKNAGIERFLKQ